MCRTQRVLVLVALFVGLAHSWDIAVSEGDQLVFYTNDGTVTHTVNFISHNLSALAYDELHNTMLYVDKQRDSDIICGYNLLSMENKCFIKRIGSNIDSIAFDPATDTLFFTDTNERSINWISLKPGSNKNINGNLFLKLEDGSLSSIAVDSCGGYIYWTNPNILQEEYIEKARFNGSEREVLSDFLPMFSLAIDQQTRKTFYFGGCEDCNLGLTRGDPNGRNGIIIVNQPYPSAPRQLTVSKDYLYWINGSESNSTIWQLPKISWPDTQPNKISKFYNKRPLSIAANYKIKEQIQGRRDCEALASLIPTTTVTDNSLNIQQTTEYPIVLDPYCGHGINDSETSLCKCTPGYFGERCNGSVCENYCLQGDCSINDEGLPKCRCNGGYSGQRCKVYACDDYCMNRGECSINEENKPVCKCVIHHFGVRCEQYFFSYHGPYVPRNFTAMRNRARAHGL